MLNTIRHACFAHPKLMINASTFGLHGTQRFQQLLPNDDWIYLPDIIQEGNAIRSFMQASQLIVGCDQPDAQLKIRELLRPLFPRAQQYLFMPVLDAEFTKLSISGMLATRISYMNDLASVAENLASILSRYVRAWRQITASVPPTCSLGSVLVEKISHMIFVL